MKKWLGLAATAALGVTLTAAAPAEAAAYTIYGSSEITGFDTWTVFKASGCNADYARPVAQGGLTGIDSVIVDITGRTSIRATWSATAKADTLVANLAAKFLTGACQDIATPFSVQSLTPGQWNFAVPAGTKWMVITARNTVNVTISF